MGARKIIKKEAIKNFKGNFKNALIVMLIIGIFGLLGSILTSIVYDVVCINIYGWNASSLASLYVNGAITFSEYMESMSDIGGDWRLNLINLAGGIISFISCIFVIAQAGFFIKTSEGKNPTVKDFIKEKRFGESFVLYLLMTVKIFLWTLLLIVPGIIKAFSYSMAPYLKYNNPDKTASECIKESERIMMGYKGSLFVLYLSFIGWWLLQYAINFALGYIPGIAGSIVVMIVNFVTTAILNVYLITCVAIFYRELTSPFLSDKYGFEMNGGNFKHENNDGTVANTNNANAAAGGNGESSASPFASDETRPESESEEESGEKSDVDFFASEERNTQSGNNDDVDHE